MPGKVAGRNSQYLINSPHSPARLETQDNVVLEKIVIDFDIVAREGQFSDTTIANYSSRNNESMTRMFVGYVETMLPTYYRGELTTKFEGLTPKNLSFDIIMIADHDLSPLDIKNKIILLQSLCYPRFKIAGNPPLCMLYILKLYALEVYVQQVLVNWHNRWDLESGLPMGADISMSVMMHQYPIREDVLQGATFDSTKFIGRGVGGWAGTNSIDPEQT